MDTVGMQILHIKRSIRYDPDMDMLPIWKYPGIVVWEWVLLHSSLGMEVQTPRTTYLVVL